MTGLITEVFNVAKKNLIQLFLVAFAPLTALFVFLSTNPTHEIEKNGWGFYIFRTLGILLSLALYAALTFLALSSFFHFSGGLLLMIAGVFGGGGSIRGITESLAQRCSAKKTNSLYQSRPVWQQILFGISRPQQLHDPLDIDFASSQKKFIALILLGASTAIGFGLSTAFLYPLLAVGIVVLTQSMMHFVKVFAPKTAVDEALASILKAQNLLHELKDFVIPDQAVDRPENVYADPGITYKLNILRECLSKIRNIPTLSEENRRQLFISAPKEKLNQHLLFKKNFEKIKQALNNLTNKDNKTFLTVDPDNRPEFFTHQKTGEENAEDEKQREKITKRNALIFFSWLTLTALVTLLFYIFTGLLTIQMAFWVIPLIIFLGFTSFIAGKKILDHTTAGPYGEWIATLSIIATVLFTLIILSILATQLGLGLTAISLSLPGLAPMLVMSGALLFIILPSLILFVRAANNYAHQDAEERKNHRSHSKLYSASKILLTAFKILLAFVLLFLVFISISPFFNIAHLSAQWLTIFSIITPGLSMFCAYFLIENILQKSLSSTDDLKTSSGLEKTKIFFGQLLKLIFNFGVPLFLFFITKFSLGATTYLFLPFFLVIGVMPLLSDNVHFSYLTNDQEGWLYWLNNLYNKIMGTAPLVGKYKFIRLMLREIFVDALLFMPFIFISVLTPTGIIFLTGSIVSALIRGDKFISNCFVEEILPHQTTKDIDKTVLVIKDEITTTPRRVPDNLHSLLEIYKKKSKDNLKNHLGLLLATAAAQVNLEIDWPEEQRTTINRAIGEIKEAAEEMASAIVNKAYAENKQQLLKNLSLAQFLNLSQHAQMPAWINSGIAKLNVYTLSISPASVVVSVIGDGHEKFYSYSPDPNLRRWALPPLSGDQSGNTSGEASKPKQNVKAPSIKNTVPDTQRFQSSRLSPLATNPHRLDLSEPPPPKKSLTPDDMPDAQNPPTQQTDAITFGA